MMIHQGARNFKTLQWNSCEVTDRGESQDGKHFAYVITKTNFGVKRCVASKKLMELHLFAHVSSSISVKALNVSHEQKTAHFTCITTKA